MLVAVSSRNRDRPRPGQRPGFRTIQALPRTCRGASE